MKALPAFSVKQHNLIKNTGDKLKQNQLPTHTHQVTGSDGAVLDNYNWKFIYRFIYQYPIFIEEKLIYFALYIF